MREVVKDDMVAIEFPDLMVVRVTEVWTVQGLPELVGFISRLPSGAPITSTTSSFKVFEEFPQDCVMGALLVTGNIDAFI